MGLDIINKTLKKDLGLKKLDMGKIKEPKLPTGLPKNNKLKNIFNISKGRSNRKGLVTAIPALAKPKRDIFRKRNKYRNEISFKSAGNKGMNRLKQQKGLNPWGDYDGDKLMNMLDCNPRNKFEQGPEHSLEDKINLEDELEREEVNDPMDAPDISPGAIEEPMEEDTQRQTAISKLGAFLGRRNMDRRVEEEDLRARAARQARRQEEQRRLAQLTRIEREKMRKRPGDDARMAFRQVGGSFSTISSAGQSLGGFGVSQGALVSSVNPSQYKILAVLGKAPPVQEVPTQPQQTPQNGARAAQRDPQTGVYSPYSERRVSYVRGPYKKGGEQ